MAHEKLADTVEDLEAIERMLTKRIEESIRHRETLEAERKLVQEKIAALKRPAGGSHGA